MWFASERRKTTMRKLLLAAVALAALAGTANAFETKVAEVPSKFQGSWCLSKTEADGPKTASFNNWSGCPKAQLEIGPRSIDYPKFGKCQAKGGWGTNTVAQIKFECSAARNVELSFEFFDDHLLVTKVSK
jgi:hypothetical protein